MNLSLIGVTGLSHCLVLVQPRKTRPDILKVVDWGVKKQINQNSINTSYKVFTRSYNRILFSLWVRF